MDDQRIILRAALRLKNFCHSLPVKRVCGKAIDGFRRDSDKAARAQECADFRQRRLVVRCDLIKVCLHGSPVPFQSKCGC